MAKAATFLPINEFFFKNRAYLISPLCFFMVLVFWKEWETAELIWPLGLMLIYLGALLRIWAQRYCQKRIKSREKGHNCLKREGPYRLIRNPLYVGNILILCGMCILSELIWLLPITLLWSFFIYSKSIRYEEQVLGERFKSEYLAYCNLVPRWCPHLGQLKEIFLPWKDALLVELGLLFLPALFLLKEMIGYAWRGM